MRLIIGSSGTSNHSLLFVARWLRPAAAATPTATAATGASGIYMGADSTGGAGSTYIQPATSAGFSCVLTQMISAVAGPWICNGEVGLHRAGRFGTTVTVAFMGTGTENIHSYSGMRIGATVKFTL